MLRNLKDMCTKFWKDEEGIQTLEILLIIAVIVFIALAFRKEIGGWISDLLDKSGKEIEKFDNTPVD